MNWKRTLTLAAVGSALAIWLAAAATSGPGAPIDPIVPRVSPLDSRGEALAIEIARLHEHLRPTATPRMPSRNLFSFTPRPAAPPPLPPPLPPRPALSEAATARPSAPPLKLSGIAEDKIGDGVVRSAIISGLNQLFVVKEGEPVTDRYRVVKISPEVVELSDAVLGTTIRLALK